MKKLKIESFLILKNIEIEYRNALVIIGPQAEGKSLISKLIYFFENIELKLVLEVSKRSNKNEFNKSIRENFLKIFSIEDLKKITFLYIMNLKVFHAKYLKNQIQIK